MWMKLLFWAEMLIGGILAIFFLYLASRVVTAGYYDTKRHYEKGGGEAHDERSTST
jgi:hypothetical protein